MQIPHQFQNWIELSSSALKNNITQFEQWVGPKAKIAAVIKSNAYGHGLVEMAKLYDQSESIAALCVINLTEALIIRKHNIKKPIIVIGYLDADYKLIVQNDIEVILYDLAIAQQLNEIGTIYKKQIKVHIKFDTGMHRLGLKKNEIAHFIAETEQLKNLAIVGIFTHLAQSYNPESTLEQENIFKIIKSFGYPVHCSNSHGILTIHHQYDFARIGIGLYGYLARAPQSMQDKLQPVLSLKTKVLQIKTIQKGDFVGYEKLFQAPADMTIATIAIGYYEGLDAKLSNCGFVIVNGQYAPIIGRVCMNLTIINISAILDCHVGQVVTVLGTDGKATISPYDWAKMTKASVYNHLVKISPNIPKIIID
ncbi:MAG: alanine racemase [Candidatus Chromulinivorax sp.]